MYSEESLVGEKTSKHGHHLSFTKITTNILTGFQDPKQRTTQIKLNHNSKEIKPFHTAFPVAC